MTQLIRLLIWIALLGGCAAMQAQEKKQLTLDDIFASEQFSGKTVSNIQWLPDGSAFTFNRSDADGLSDIYRHEVASGAETLILQASALAFDGSTVEMSAYQTTGMQNTLLITGPRRQIWRHSYAAPYFLYNIEDKALIALAKGDPNLQNVTLSPDGNSVAFVRDNNLYIAAVETGDARPLTTDGSGDILNGVFDWVYEEEFGRADAYRWSPDGSHIAFWRTDQSRVKSFTMLDELPYYSVPIALKYPKVGEQNAVVQIQVADVTTGKIVSMDIGDDDDIYIPRIDWSHAPNTLAIQRLNRKQNTLELLMAYTPSGKTSKVLADVNEAWVDVTDDFFFLRKQNSFVWTSEKSGFRHIYISDYTGATKQLTNGDWEVSSIIGVDEPNNLVYFYAKKTSPIHQHIFRVKASGGTVEQISATHSWHDASFSPDYQHYVAFSSNVRIPTKVTLRKADGSLVRTLEENNIEALQQYDMVYPEFLIINTNDGVKLNAYMMKPANFNPAKKYPVLVFGYGGPGSQMVLDRWGAPFRNIQRTLWHQMLTEKGYIVFCLDNRGTGGQGKAFKNLSYGDLSRWSVNDQILGARYLRSLSYVDGERIGFWGWSGGGYLTCMIMTRAAEFFKAGIAVASVSDFRNYDTIWTERYMGLLSENKAGYDAANVNNYADGMKGNFLIIHGSGDDNVHPQNSLQFINELIAKNKAFDMMIYPNRNHRISGGNTSRHLFTKMTRFILENL